MCVQRFESRPRFPSSDDHRAHAVSYERFTDYVRNAVDFYFVLGLVRGQALVTAMYKNFGIGSPDARARCAEFFREPPDIAELRESLMKKQERLRRAQELLANAAI